MKSRGSSVNIDALNPRDIALEDPTEMIAQREVLTNALQLLKEEQRKVIELRIIKGYSVADTARIMDKKEGNIRVIQYRAIEHLTKILEEEK